MGLFLWFRCDPSPPALNVSDDSLPAFVYVNVLDRDLLSPLAPMAIECGYVRDSLLAWPRFSFLPSKVCSRCMARR